MTRVPVGRMAAMNRRVWNDISDPWQRRREGEWDWRRFKRGRLYPDAASVRGLMGPVRGRTVLDLQCGSGEAALTWAILGARVTGLDLSERRLAEARKKAALAGRRVTYLRGNVVRQPFRDRTFDKVYTGGGIVAWIPDVNRWAREIARVLKPGGRFVYNCRHPFTHCLGEGRGSLPAIAPARGGYFDATPLTYHGMTSWMKRPKLLPHVERNWSMGRLLNALSGAGLRPVRFVETPVGGWWGNRRLPRDYRGAFPVGLDMAWDKPTGRRR